MTSLPAKLTTISHLEPRSIVVFRALFLGDMLCAMPALASLRATLPDARITLVSQPWAENLVERYPALLDDFIAFPGGEGFDTAATPAEQAAFLQRVRHRRFDLSIQLHGNGSVSNALVESFGATVTAGFVPDGEAADAWHLPYPSDGHETERLRRLMRHLGCVDVADTPRFPIHDDERGEAALLLAERAAGGSPWVVVHPGAKLASRRWGTERFAAVARALSDEGFTVLLTGSEAERHLTGAVAAQAPGAVDLAGCTSLGVLAALIEGADLIVANDTGVVHLAAALGTRSVVVACGSETERWAMPDSERSRTLFADVPCRPCFFDECPYEGHPCADAVAVPAVTTAALDRLAGAAQ